MATNNDFGINIEFGRLPTVLLDEAKSPRLMRDAQIVVIDYVQPLVERVLWERTPVGTGLARTLIQYERPRKGDIDPRGRVGFAQPASDYMLFVETGTQPHWAPLDGLALWGARKFGDAMVGWYVRMSISKRGTKAQWFVKYAADLLTPPVTDMMIDRLVEYLNAPWSRIRNSLGV